MTRKRMACSLAVLAALMILAGVLASESLSSCTALAAVRIALCQSAVSASGVVPSWRARPTRSLRGFAAERTSDATARSPYRAPMYAQNAWPQRYGKYFGLSRSLMAGSLCLSFSWRTASRIHMAVFESTGPSEKYSAMPSMNHNGSRSAPFSPGAALGDVVISNWNA